jgi:hypothetical protein
VKTTRGPHPPSLLSTGALALQGASHADSVVKMMSMPFGGEAAQLDRKLFEEFKLQANVVHALRAAQLQANGVQRKPDNKATGEVGVRASPAAPTFSLRGDQLRGHPA